MPRTCPSIRLSRFIVASELDIDLYPLGVYMCDGSIGQAMAYLTLRTLLTAFLALLISAGQICACTSGLSSLDDISQDQTQTAHHNMQHGSAHHAGSDQSNNQHEAPGRECGHCSQPPYVKASTASDLSASLSGALSLEKFAAPSESIAPRFKVLRLKALVALAWRDPRPRTPVSLKIQLLI